MWEMWEFLKNVDKILKMWEMWEMWDHWTPCYWILIFHIKRKKYKRSLCDGLLVVVVLIASATSKVISRSWLWWDRIALPAHYAHSFWQVARDLLYGSSTDMAGHTKAFDYPVAQTWLDIPRPLITQSHRHGWTYQGRWLPSRTDMAGHTKAFDYPVTQTRLDIPRPLITQSHTRLDIPRPLITQSHRHGWTYQGLWLPSHTDTAGHTKAFDYPVTQTRLDIPRPLITQSHRHGWTYQGLWLPSHTDTAGHAKVFDYPVTQTRLDMPKLWLPSHTDTAGHTKAFDYPVTQTRLDIPRPLITQSHRHGWTFQDLWLPSHTDTAGHTKAFDYPVTRTQLDIPRPLITQSHRHGWTFQGLWLPSHTHSWTYQGLWLPSHTDTAGYTKAFDYPVTQTRLDIPRSLITQSHRHGWTYQGFWLPSHTDTAGHTKAFDYPVAQTRLDIPRLWLPSHTYTAGHTKAFDYPVTQTRLDIPRPLITQSHRHGWTYQGLWLPSRTHGWTYQGLWLPSHTDTAGHTKAFDYPVTQTRLDMPRPLTFDMLYWYARWDPPWRGCSMKVVDITCWWRYHPRLLWDRRWDPETSVAMSSTGSVSGRYYSGWLCVKKITYKFFIFSYSHYTNFSNGGIFLVTRIFSVLTTQWSDIFHQEKCVLK